MDYLTTRTSLSPIRRAFASGFVNYKKGALDSQPQVIRFTSCLPMVGGSLASSTTKTGRDIAESGVKHNKLNQINFILKLSFVKNHEQIVCLFLYMVH